MTSLLSFVVLSFTSNAQNHKDVYDIAQSIGNTRVHLETGGVFYKNITTGNYNKFGFGVGAEGLWQQDKFGYLSLGLNVAFRGAHEERKTYSVENAQYYYRSTTLTGRLLASPVLGYKRNMGRQIQIGVGLQPSIVLASFKDYYTLGLSASPIPDVTFQRTELAVVSSISYVIDPNWMVNIIGQYTFSPLTQGENPSYARGLSMQLSRKIR